MIMTMAVGPIFKTQPNPTHDFTDPTQPNPTSIRQSLWSYN